MFKKQLLIVAIALLSSSPLLTSYAEHFDEVYKYRTEFGTDDEINQKLFHYYLNLSRPGLEKVKKAVDTDNYADARKYLLEYYRANSSRDDTGGGQNDTITGDMMVDDLYKWSYVDYRIAEFSVPRSPSEIVVDVTDNLKNTFWKNSRRKADGANERYSYMIMGKTKKHAPYARKSGWKYENVFPLYAIYRPSYVELCTRESSEHKPMLRISINGQERNIIADKDTFVRYGFRRNYGKETFMEVRASGFPFNQYESRSYVSFNIADFLKNQSIEDPDKIESAKLILYGKIQDSLSDKNTAKSENVYLFRTSDKYLPWDESTFHFRNGLTTGTVSYRDNVDTYLSADGGDKIEYVNNSFVWQDFKTSSGASDSHIYEFNFVRNLARIYKGTKDKRYLDKTVFLIRDFMRDCSPVKGNEWKHTWQRSEHLNELFFYLLKENALTPDDCANMLLYIFIPNEANFNDESNKKGTGNLPSRANRSFARTLKNFPELKQFDEWKAEALNRVEYVICRGFKKDGTPPERSDMYSRANLGYWSRQFAYLNGICDESEFEQYNLQRERIMEALNNLTYPNGLGLAFGDSNTELRAGGFTRDTCPDYTSIHYPDGNYTIMRSEWDWEKPLEQRYLFLNNNSGGGHAHQDGLSIMAYAYNNMLLIDPGKAKYGDNGKLNVAKDFLGSPRAHNTTTIYTVSEGPDKKIIGVHQKIRGETKKLYWETSDSFDFYEGYDKKHEGITSHRGVLFVKPDFWIVSDYLVPEDANKEYLYEQTWHYLPSADPVFDLQSKATRTQFIKGGNIQVVPAYADELDRAGLDDGWYAKSTINIVNAEFSAYAKKSSGVTTFDTVLYPTKKGSTGSVKVKRIPISPDRSLSSAVALEIDPDDGSGETLVYYHSREKDPRTSRRFAAFDYDGKLAFAALRPDGQIARVSMYKGTRFQHHGSDLIRFTTLQDSCSAKWLMHGTRLELTMPASTGGEVRILAPMAEEVVVNGEPLQPTQFTRQDGYLTIGVSRSP